VSIPYEIILVDNASTDESIPLLKSMFPWVRLIQSSKNFGFAAGNNCGAKIAKGQFLLLFNNDTLLLTDIAPAVSYLSAHPEVGILGAKMHDGEGNYRHSAYHFPFPHRLFKFSNRIVTSGPFLKGTFPNVIEPVLYNVDYIEGSFLLTRKSLWEELGGLDEYLFMYGEDSEFCYRVKRYGFTTVYFPEIKYIHYGGFSPRCEYLIVKGIKYFHKKWSPLSTYILVIIMLYLRLILRLIVYGVAFLINGNSTHLEKVKSSITALGNI
jgi:GT2 family glycosyltransferase